MQNAILIGVGLFAGVISGLFGVGGGLVIVPALMLFIAVPLKTSIGTSLGALLLPVGLLGVMEYYRGGYINVKYSLLIALGLFVGAYFGARIVHPLSPIVLRRIYGVFLALVSVKMFWGK